MCNTIFRELILVSGSNESKGGAIAALVFYVLIFFILLILLTVAFVYELMQRESPKVFKSALYCVGAAVYYYGDNIDYVMYQYGEVLGCYQGCYNNIKTSALIFLGASLTCYHLFPPLVKKFIKLIKENDDDDDNDDNQNKNTIKNFADIMAVIPKVDVMFTAVMIATQTNQCDKAGLTFSSSFITVSIVLGIFLIICHCICAFHDKYFVFLIVLSCVLALVFPFYMLADNVQPFNCAFGCNYLATNVTAEFEGCNAKLNSGIRFFLMTFVFLVIIFVSVPFLMYVCCRNDDDDED